MSIRRKKTRKEIINQRDSIVRLLDDMELYFGEELLIEVTELYQEGHSPEAIGKAIKRDPDEVFIALFHQARRDRVDRPFAYRA